MKNRTMKIMSYLYIIRHGQGSFGTENYDKLSELGLRQSKILAEHFEQKGICFDAVYSGTLNRQKETAEGYLKHMLEHGKQVPILKNHIGLNEFDLKSVFIALSPLLLKENPDFDKDIQNFRKDREAFRRILKKTLLMWVSEKYDLPEITSWKDFASGVNQAINQIIDNEGHGKTIALFTSGGPILAAVQRAKQDQNEQTINLVEQIVNTSVNQFRYEENQIHLLSFNEHKHLLLSGDQTLKTYI